MADERRHIVYGSQGGVDDPPTPPAGQSGAGQPGGSNSGQGAPDASNSGQAQAGGGSKDPGKRGPDSLDVSDQIWAKASNHYQPKIKQLETELTEYRNKYAAEQVKSKTAEQIALELKDFKDRDVKRTATLAEFAESRKKSLPEHLQSLLDQSAGGDPYKAIELLPGFEDIAKRTQLKTIGGNAGGNSGPSIDFKTIREAQDRGDIRPYQDAIKQHGMQVYNAGLQKWLAERGR